MKQVRVENFDIRQKGTRVMILSLCIYALFLENCRHAGTDAHNAARAEGAGVEEDHGERVHSR
jgi:hypothetical protein